MRHFGLHWKSLTTPIFSPFQFCFHLAWKLTRSLTDHFHLVSFGWLLFSMNWRFCQNHKLIAHHIHFASLWSLFEYNRKCRHTHFGFAWNGLILAICHDFVDFDRVVILIPWVSTVILKIRSDFDIFTHLLNFFEKCRRRPLFFRVCFAFYLPKLSVYHPSVNFWRSARPSAPMMLTILPSSVHFVIHFSQKCRRPFFRIRQQCHQLALSIFSIFAKMIQNGPFFVPFRFYLFICLCAVTETALW